MIAELNRLCTDCRFMTPMPQIEYVPGVCNIGPDEIARRRNLGWVSLAISLALMLALYGQGSIHGGDCLFFSRRRCRLPVFCRHISISVPGLPALGLLILARSEQSKKSMMNFQRKRIRGRETRLRCMLFLSGELLQ